MGSGVAEVAAFAGFHVVIVKATAGSLDSSAIKRVEGSLDRSVAKGKLTQEARDAARGRMTFSADLDRACAVRPRHREHRAETIASKKRILSEIEAATGPARHRRHEHVVVSLAQLAAASSVADRFVGLHFFSPVPAMKLVEVGRLSTTGQDIIAAALVSSSRSLRQDAGAPRRRAGVTS